MDRRKQKRIKEDESRRRKRVRYNRKFIKWAWKNDAVTRRQFLYGRTCQRRAEDGQWVDYCTELVWGNFMLSGSNYTDGGWIEKYRPLYNVYRVSMAGACCGLSGSLGWVKDYQLYCVNRRRIADEARFVTWLNSVNQPRQIRRSAMLLDINASRAQEHHAAAFFEACNATSAIKQ